MVASEHLNAECFVALPARVETSLVTLPTINIVVVPITQVGIAVNAGAFTGPQTAAVVNLAGVDVSQYVH